MSGLEWLMGLALIAVDDEDTLLRMKETMASLRYHEERAMKEWIDIGGES